MSFSQRLKHFRAAAGLTQRALGNACGWGEGMSAQSRVGNYEQALREPYLTDIVKMAKVLGVSPELLAFGDRSELTDDELELLQAYRQADKDGRASFKALSKALQRSTDRLRPVAPNDVSTKRR